MAKRTSILVELWQLVLERKVYVLAPIIIVLLLLIGLVVFGGSAASPFIYPLF
jgi:hypothetical protein